MKILSLKGAKRIREMKTSLEALKYIYLSCQEAVPENLLSGGSTRKPDDRSIEIRNLKEENRVKENRQSFGAVQGTTKYTPAILSGIAERVERNAGKADNNS